MFTSANNLSPLAACSRRKFLSASAGLGSLALYALAEPSAQAAPPLVTNPLAPKRPHFRARARSVIWCFLDGGPSHIDLFDPKPELQKLSGKPLPASITRPMTAMGVGDAALLGTKRKFAQHGQSGLWVSDWYPEIARCVDDLAVIRSCHADGVNHVGSVCQMNTGSILGGRPCLGSWTTYGLGSESEELPGYVVLCDGADDPPGGNRQWSTGFMPPAFQGTRFQDGKTPVLHAAAAGAVSPEQQRAKLDYIQQLNALHRAPRGDDQALSARIASLELAYRMQSAAPLAVDLAQESAETLALYGLSDKETTANGRNCLLARRLVERGVRFVQCYMGSGSKWDAHTDVEGNHTKHCKASDRPIAGLLTDLRRRGLLDTTLVIWGGEFGRTPMGESGTGRDHNPYGFTIWMAGGGVRGGMTYGSTDEVGLYAVENRVHIHDLHATILHLLGIDHLRLTYLHNGRDERATINGGKVIREVLV